MEFDNKVPIYLQVIQDIKVNIVKGNLSLGEKLPSSRELAYRYSINPNTANRIYKELEAEQLCFTRRGLGTYITEDKEKIHLVQKEMAQEVVENFIKGMNQLAINKEEAINLIQTYYSQTEI